MTSRKAALENLEREAAAMKQQVRVGGRRHQRDQLCTR